MNDEAGVRARPPLQALALGDLEHELALNRTVLERVPEEHMGWKPHERSYSLGELATHLARLTDWGVITLRTDELDLAEMPDPREAAADRAELLELHDAHTAAFVRAVAEADEAELAGSWRLRHGDDVILEMPRVAVLRSMVLSHAIHHRAQLGVYLRLLDEPVPAIYGPSADEAGM